MANFYIDPSSGTDGIGTIGDPFNTWASALPLAASNAYYQKSGTTEALTTTINPNGVDNLTIGSYDAGAKPILQRYRTSTSTGDWSEVETNVWEYVHSVSGGANGSYLLGLTTLGQGTIGERVSYDDSGGSVTGWNNFGDFSDSPSALSLYVYADANPVTKWTTVYWGVFDDFCFQFTNCDNTTVNDINFNNCVQGFAIDCQESGTPHGSGNYHGNEFTDVNRGIYVVSDPTDATKIVDSALIHDNTFDSVGAVPIAFFCHSHDVEVYTNTFDNWGLTESQAAIYGNNTSDSTMELEIYDNTIRGGTYGRYWFDGDGIYADNGSNGWHVYANDIADMLEANMAGIRDNSGGARIQYNSNIIDNVPIMAQVTDSQDIGGTSTEFYNNIGTNLTDGLSIQNIDGTPGTITWDNNIAIGTGVAITNGTTSTFDATKNNYFGFSDTTGVEVGAEIVNPLLVGFQIAENSPISGIDTAITPSLTVLDYTGVAFTNDNMGAYNATAGSIALNTGTTAGGATDYDGMWTAVSWVTVGDNSLHYPINDGPEGSGTLLAYDGNDDPVVSANAVIQNYDPGGW